MAAKTRVNFHLPVVAHNMKGYDAHFIMQFAGASGLKMGTPIAQTLEKYMTFSIGRCKFMDSMQFLNSSLPEARRQFADGRRSQIEVSTRFSRKRTRT